MNKLSITGTITIDFKSLVKLLKPILPTSGVFKDKIRIFGEEINYNSEKMGLYIYSLNPNDFQFEGNFFQSCRDGINFLDEFSLVLKNHKFSFVFDYCIANEAGTCLTKEKSKRYDAL